MQPEQIGKYRILEPLGRGAMGAVYLGLDPHIERRVAIKVLAAPGPGARERFLQEARTIGHLSHPNIVVLLEFGFQDEQPFLVMEYLPGESLETWLERPHPVAEHLRILGDLIRAVDHAHRHGVLHRDIKPSNIQVLPEGGAKLMDFGIALGTAPRLTATGMVLGTPEFMAPEVLRDAGYSPRSDAYTVALVAYAMLAGRNPFKARTLEGCLSKVLTLEPEPLERLRPDLPRRLTAAVMACLSKDPARRPPDLEPLAAAVDAAPRDDPGEPSPTLSVEPTRALPATAPPPAPRRRRGLGAAAAAAVVLLATLGWLALRPGPVESPREPVVSTPDGMGEAAGNETGAPPETAEAPAPETASSSRATVPAPVEARESSPPPAARTAGSGAESTPRRDPASPPAEPEIGRAAGGSDPAPDATAGGRQTPAPPPPDETPVAAPPPPPTAAEDSRPSAPARENGESTTPRRDLLDALLAPAAGGPALREVAPRVVRRGRRVVLRLSGEELAAGSRLEVRRGSATAGEVRVLDVASEEAGNEIRAVIFVEESAPLGSYSLRLVDPAGRATNSLLLEVSL